MDEEKKKWVTDEHSRQDEKDAVTMTMYATEYRILPKLRINADGLDRCGSTKNVHKVQEEQRKAERNPYLMSTCK